MATAHLNIAHTLGLDTKKTKWSFSHIVSLLFSTSRNSIIDKRIDKLESSMNLVWSELTTSERISYMYHKAATLRAIQRMEMLKN